MRNAFHFNSAVGTIGLPTAPAGPSWAQTAGWGRLATAGHQAHQLQRLDNVQVLSQQSCIHIIGTRVRYMDYNKVCASTRYGQGVCSGDSGGPLFIGRTVIGLASWSFVPCGTELPDGWERVFSHRNWILSII